MRTFGFIVFLLVLAALAGGGYWLVTWDIPVPAERVEKPIADDRLPR